MRKQVTRQLNILGIRGIPAAHGGFETFAAHLAPYLVERGWKVRVYCQHDSTEVDTADRLDTDDWNGIVRKHVYVHGGGAVSTIKFDWKSTRDALRQPGIDLVLGYNTAIFTILERLAGRPIMINMDGIEWKRAKWPLYARAWLLTNEFIGARAGTVVADHPEIATHLKRLPGVKPHVIAYGANRIDAADSSALSPYRLQPDRYMISIARIEPENSILEQVRAFSRKRRDANLVVLGNLNSTPYHDAVRAAASDEVIFPGAIFEPAKVSALRFFARAYTHGHQVGGTNPSLVEALGAGNAVLAHDNKYNRWTAGDAQFFFRDEDACDNEMTRILEDDDAVTQARGHARAQFDRNFRWEFILEQYRKLLERVIANGGSKV